MRYAIDLLGVAVFAISGVLAAARKGLDLLGISVVAVVTAIGGGTIRDLLLDRNPIFWIADTTYLWVALASIGLTLAGLQFWLASRRAVLIADALGLAFFAISGAQITLQLGHPLLIAVLMGTITGVAGGVLRDVLTRDVPLVLSPGHLYATAAIAGCVLYVLLSKTPMPGEAAALCGMALTAGLRLAAIAFDLSLPRVPMPPEDHRLS